MSSTAEFQEDPAVRPEDRPSDEERLVVDLEGYEGPIDVLLALAREQKVDITRISILALADQYIAFIAQARRVRLEIAADYLVMAAWLAYLKSRLLLPTPSEDKAEPTAADMAAALAFQLQRLQAMQDAGARLMARPQLGKDVFLRGAPEG
ncbi:MAG TPA: ScpA family protein, partial [Alphaproteobacteria bacterium]|nr:ScpA family protein [Alphaproteobacteria bacterium]